MAVCCLLLVLAGCQNTPPPATPSAPAGEEAHGLSIHGTVNRLGDFLVLLSDEGEYLVFDLGAEVETDEIQEGDTVTVTYTGTLGSEDPPPVAKAIVKAEES